MTAALATKDATGTGLVVFEQPGGAVAEYDYSQDAGVGLEGGADAIKMPFIRLAQGLTPQVETVDGLKAGSYFNTITNEVFPGDKGFVFIPVLLNEKVVEWEGETGKGVYVGSHDPESDLYRKAVAELPDGIFSFDSAGKIIRPKTPDGNELVHTRYAWGILYNEATGDITPAGISFSSTHTNAWKNWYSVVSTQTVVTPTGRTTKAPWAFGYRITSTKKSNDKGSWFVPQIAFANGGKAELSKIPSNSELANVARGLYTLIKKGEVDIDMSAQGDGSDSVTKAAAGGGAGSGAAKDSKIPF